MADAERVGCGSAVADAERVGCGSAVADAERVGCVSALAGRGASVFIGQSREPPVPGLRVSWFWISGVKRLCRLKFWLGAGFASVGIACPGRTFPPARFRPGGMSLAVIV